MPETHTSAILNVLYILLSNETDSEILLLTVKAFGDYIPHSKIFFHNQEQKNILLSLIYGLCNHSSEMIRFQSVQILLDVVRTYYDVLESNIDDLLKISMQKLEDEESIAILTYEIWCSICDTEIARSIKNSHLPNREYSNKVYPMLLKAILNHIVQISTDQDKWS